MSTIRRERREEQLVRELSDILQNRLKDPRRDWISITRVELSADLRYARVHVSVFGDSKRQKDGVAMLDGACHFIRAELGRRLHVRHVPEIRFRLDESLEASQRVMEILDTLDIPDQSELDGNTEGDTP
jgi:ribosome-binding factor A